jgi:hypothetical protein
MRDHLTVADDLRPSDAERDQVVRDLTKHCGDGRLTLDELEQRVAEVYAAGTKDELRHAVRELPSSQVRIPSAPPMRVKPSSAPVRTKPDVDARRNGEVALRIHLVVYLSVIGLLTAIWFLTSGVTSYYWPIWTAMPWGMALAIHAGVHKAVWAGR